MNNHLHRRLKGMTIVELLVVIVVIGILSAVVTISYNAIRKDSAEAALVSNLSNVARKIKVMQFTGRTISTSAKDIINEPKDLQISIVSSGGATYYTNLSDQQKAALLLSVCTGLVDEGYGYAEGDFGSHHHYISGCYVYHPHTFQVNGWLGSLSLFQPPTGISLSTIQAYKDAAVSLHPLHPTFHLTVSNFMDEMVSRYTEVGGTFPIGELYEQLIGLPDMPEPESLVGGSYCVVARHVKYEDIVYYATSQELEPKPGDSCS